jgi:HSP20 family molecular chaperone IbpA
MCTVGGEGKLSAKWRRNKKTSRQIDILKALSKLEDRKVSLFRARHSWIKRQAYPYKSKVARTNSERKSRELEPLIDVIDEDGEIMIVAEFAGFNRENIRIHVKSQRLALSAETSDRKYYKSLNLPKRVIPSTMRAKCKNGVLEIKLKKALEEKAIDKVAG